MLDALAINTSDLPADVVDLLGKITEVQDSQHSMTFSAKELGLISQAVGGMKHAYTRGLRGAPSDEAVSTMVEMLTEMTSIEKRIEVAVRDAFVSRLGEDFDKSDAAKKLDSLMAEQAARVQARADVVTGSPVQNAAYL